MKEKSLPQITKTDSGKFHATVNYTTTDGRRTSKSFTNADKSRLVLDILAFQADRVSTGSMTLRQAMNRYIETKSRVLSPGTIRGYRSIINVAYPDIMEVDISKLTSERLQIAVNQHAGKASPKTVSNHYGLLTATLTMYRPEFKPNVTLPQPKKKKKLRIPTTAEVRQLTAAAQGTKMELPVILAATLGLRRSEICALTPSDIDFERGVVTVDKAMVKAAGRGFVIKAPKTVTSERMLKVIPWVTEMLRVACEGKADDERITVHPASVTKGFMRLCKRAGVKPCRFHDLRHYAASVMLGQGYPKNYVVEKLGHSSSKMVDEVYGHTLADIREDLEARLSTYFDDVFVQANASKNALKNKKDIDA